MPMRTASPSLREDWAWDLLEARMPLDAREDGRDEDDVERVVH